MACRHIHVVTHLAKVLVMDAAVEGSSVPNLVIYGIIKELYFVFGEVYPCIVDRVTCAERCNSNLTVCRYVAGKVQFT